MDYFYTLAWIHPETGGLCEDYMGKDLDLARKYAAAKSVEFGECWINAVSAQAFTSPPVGVIRFEAGVEVDRDGLVAA